MPLQKSIFQRVKLVIFGNIPKKDTDSFFEVNTCSKCEIRKLYLAELKKHYGEEHQNNKEETKEEQEWPDETDDSYLFKQSL